MKTAIDAKQKKHLIHAVRQLNGFRKLIVMFVLLVLTTNCTIITGTSEIKLQAASSTPFAALRDSLTKEILAREIEEWRILGAPEAAGHLKDWSPEAIKAEVEFCRKALQELASIQISSPAEKLDKEVLTAHFKYLEYYYGQYHGELGNLRISVYPYDVIQYELQRFESSKTPDAESARNHYGAVEGILRALPAHLKQQQANLLAGLKLRKPDREILLSIIKTIGSPNDSGSIRGGLKAFGENLKSAKIASLLPTEQIGKIQNLLKLADEAYSSHLDFLNGEIMSNASESWTLGMKEYTRRFELIYEDGALLDELVRDAEAELNRINAEMVVLARQLKPGLSLNKVFEELRKQHFNSEQELLKAYEQVQEKIDKNITSRIGLEVGAASYQPAPPGVPVSPATNWPAPLLSRGKGIVLVDTSIAGLMDNAIVDLPWITVHEGNPGHASQSLLFQKAFNEGRASLCRFFNVPDEVGYVRGNWYSMANIEGWALFTERLLLKSNLLTREERLAALSGQALRAARVVVDVRMHTAGWSRDDVTRYLVEKVGMSTDDAKKQTFRYSRIPLQAVSYYFGARQFEELEENYKEQFGDQFYRQVLSLGPVPPRFIRNYLESSKASTK